MIKSRTIFFWLTLFFGLTTDVKAQGTEAEATVSVSIFELIAAPNRFHGRDIIVAGVYRFDLDLATLYPSKEYLVEDVFQSSISLELPANLNLKKLEALMALDGHFIRVNGTFDAKNRGFGGFNYGTIINVKEIVKN